MPGFARSVTLREGELGGMKHLLWFLRLVLFVALVVMLLRRGG